MDEPLKMATALAQGLGWVEPAYRGVIPPIYMSSVYERAPDGSYPGQHSYTRDQNPTFDQPEALLANLEGGEDAMLFSSGMTAATTILEALAAGAHVIAPQKMYFTFKMWMQRQQDLGRLSLTLVPNDRPDELERQVQPGKTKLVWLESPANPGGEILDLAKWATIAKAAGALVVADNTLATPVLCKPLSLGADLVMHSASKQLNGHGDVVAGAIVTKDHNEFWQSLKFERGYRGTILGPFEAWLLLRGMRTLALRVRASAANALEVARFLQDHPGVDKVMYPGLPEHPLHEVAKSQMNGFGFVVSFCLKDSDPEAISNLLARLKVFKNGSSLGGVESLIEERGKVEGGGDGLPRGLLRLSIGIEDPNDLVDDLRRGIL